MNRILPFRPFMPARSADPVREVRAGITTHYAKLWRYCVTLAGNRPDGDDLAQAACARAMERADHYLPGTEVDRWLFRIAQRLWLNEVRARAVRRGSGLVPAEDADVGSDAEGGEAMLRGNDIFRHVAALPEAQRITLLLVYVEGYTYAEAAEQLDIPAGTVMSRLATARKALAARIGESTERS